MLQYVHHVHYVVHNRDAMVDYLEKSFGMKPDHLVVYEDRGMKDALYNVGQTHIQITEPLHPNSDIAKHLATHGPGVYHVAWGVDNLQQVALDLTAKGSKLPGKDAVHERPCGIRTYHIDIARCR